MFFHCSVSAPAAATRLISILSSSLSVGSLLFFCPPLGFTFLVLFSFPSSCRLHLSLSPPSSPVTTPSSPPPHLSIQHLFVPVTSLPAGLLLPVFFPPSLHPALFSGSCLHFSSCPSSPQSPTFFLPRSRRRADVYQESANVIAADPPSINSSSAAGHLWYKCTKCPRRWKWIRTSRWKPAGESDCSQVEMQLVWRA